MAVLSFEPEQRQGLLYSIGLHLAIIMLLMFSTQQVSITPPKGIAIQAEIMDLNEFMKNQPKPKTQPVKKDPPKPEPQKPKPKPPEPVKKQPEPKPVEQPVVKPKVDPIKRQEKTDRQKRLEEIRRQRLEAEQQAQKQPEIKTTETPKEDPQNQPPVGVENGAEDQRRTLLTQYIATIQSSVTRQWARPTGTPAGLQCQIKVNQIPGGGVIDVSIGSPCNASAVVRNSIINAVKKADPLPYTGFETVFERRLNFIFQYQGD